MIRRNPALFFRWFLALLCIAPLHAEEGSHSPISNLSGSTVSGYVSTSAQLSTPATNIQGLLPAALEGTWFAQGCQRGVETIEGTFALNISQRRRVTGWFTNATEQKVLPARGQVSRRGLLTARVQERLTLRGVLAGTTSTAARGIVLRRCTGMFESFTNHYVKPVLFPDPHLAAYLSELLDKPVDQIVASDLLSIQYLDIWDYEIGDLTGLQYATNLQQLTVAAPITNYSAVYNLPNLRYLSFYDTTNFAFLSHLPQIESLDLNYSELTNAAPLLALTNLQSLSLYDTRVANLEALAALPNLWRLDHEFRHPADAAAYGALTQLAQLSLDGPLNDLAPLGTLTNLERITLLQYTRVNFAAGLYPMRKLSFVDITRAGMRDLDWVESTNIWYLNLADNQLTNVSRLNGLHRLASLNLSGNPLGDSESLGQVPAAVTSLLVNRIGLSNLASFPEFGHLRNLQARDNSITDLSPLWNGTNLMSLFLAGNQVTSLAPLNACTRLGYLDLGGNQVSDLSPLASCTNLLSLSLASNQLSTLPDVSAVPQLSLLNLNHNNISDITALAGLKELRFLYASHNQVTNINALASNTNLFYLYLDSNQITDITALTNLPILRYVTLSDNPLNLGGGTSASNVVNTLRNRGVFVNLGLPAPLRGPGPTLPQTPLPPTPLPPSPGF